MLKTDTIDAATVAGFDLSLESRIQRAAGKKGAGA